MEFYYPNLQNDMWLIFGLVFFSDRNHFMEPGLKAFSKDRLEKFLREKRIALSDTAVQVIRHKGNASDAFLEITNPRDVGALLDTIPDCTAIVTTGEKATDTLCLFTGAAKPPVGGYTKFTHAGRTVRHYRMPSSSRAYPKRLEEEAAVYAAMCREEGLLK